MASLHYFITGASSGIGEALASKLAMAGHTVSASARRVERLEALADKVPNITAFECDVCSSAKVASAVKAAIKASGPIDVAILNAGYYAPQDARDMQIASYQKHMDVNYLGVVRCIETLLPDMLARGQGHLALMASVAGYRGLPRAAAYSPTKAAVISLAESMYFDLQESGVKLQVISPGFVKTEATEINDFDMPDLVSAQTAADEIIAGLSKNQFEIAFPRSFVRKMKLLRILPTKLYFSLMKRVISK